MTSQIETLANSLSSALEPQLGEVTISGVARLSGGASRETWSFDATQPNGVVHHLVLRRDPPTRPGWPGTMGTEARCLRTASQAGLSVPMVLLDTDSTELWGSAGIVMQRIEGETLARRILREPQFESARSTLAADCGRFLAGLHAINPHDVAPLHSGDPLQQIRTTLDTLDMVSPSFEYALLWLANNRPPPSGNAIVHGDFRLGNFIVGQDGLRSVLDWELVHQGDPIEDLGWLCVKAWRFGAAQAVGGFGSRKDLIAAYQQAGGTDVSLADLHWWEVFGTLRWGVICMTQTYAHLSGLLRSVELAAIGRRVCETEWDLLLLLEPAAAARAQTRASDQLTQLQPQNSRPALEGIYGRPSAEELLQAVQEFLTEQVMPSTEGSISFHARVASNVLAMVERELLLGPRHASERSEALSKLGISSERELAAAIASNSSTLSQTEIVDLLAQGVLSSLIVARPTYLDTLT